MNNLSMKLAYPLFSIITFFIANKAGAQVITGDTIFVNAEAEVAIKLPSRPSDFYTNPKTAPYDIKSLSSGLTIMSKTENSKSAALFVTEGGRSHSFVIVFKKDINYDNLAELVFDYSTVKRLEQHVKDSEAKKAAEAKAREAAKANAVAVDNSASNYYALLEQGDKNIKLGLYNEAKSAFEAAHKLKPDEPMPLQKIQEITSKINEQEKVGELEKNRKYVTLTGEAKALFDLKKYAESKEVYKKALNLRQGDLYATNQIEKLDKILNQRKGEEEEKRLRGLYSGYIETGEKALNKNQLSDARIAFEQALVIKQNDPVATARLKVINEREKREKESLEVENKYNDAIQAGDKLFQSGDYNAARTQYNNAIAIFRRPWPVDQIKNINKLIADISAKEIVEKQEQAKQIENQKKEREALEIENKYLNAVAEADRLFKAEDYVKAKDAYASALKISNKPWPKEQIITIDKLVAEQSRKAVSEAQQLAKQAEIERREKETLELENKYNTAIQSADNFFKAQDYKNARTEYIRAKTYFNRPWPDEQVNKIANLIEDQLAAENAEKQRIAKEAKLSIQYSAVVQRADADFDKSNYINARKLYNEAALLKPSEQHPRERLQTIETALELIAKVEKERKDSIAAAIELNKKYTLAVSKGKSYILKEDFVNAKIAYEEATGIKPTDAEAANQLEKINQKLLQIQRENELNAKYDSKITFADSLLILKEYEPALAAFNEASVIKPAETYAAKQIKYIQSEMIYQEKRREEKAKVDAYNLQIEKRRKYRELITLADKSVVEKNYEAARQQYSDALDLQPDNDYAQQRLKIVINQLDILKPAGSQKTPASNNEVVKNQPAEKSTKIPEPTEKPAESTPTKEKGSSLKFQENPIPYSPDDLLQKYPNINFKALPPEQLSLDGVGDVKGKADIFRQMLLDKPKLDISDKSNKVKLICQGLRFEEKSVYLRLLIQNNSDNDFLTGAMMLTWTRKSGSHIKLYPLYIFPDYLPILQPGNETIIIYVCKSYNIGDEDKLKFELSDRMNKNKLELNLKGSTYNLAFMR
ncbi:MAG: hypothetical protein ABIN67_01220 [Ferruginibacter sp.]